MTKVDDIKAAVPLAAVLTPKALAGICPICASGRFRVNLDEDSYACPNCGEKGDVLTATMRLVGLDFWSALAHLRKIAADGRGGREGRGAIHPPAPVAPTIIRKTNSGHDPCTEKRPT